MKRIIQITNWKNVLTLLFILSLFPVFSGCNKDDDVVGIFTGKTWKLSFIALEGSTKMYDFWGGDQAARIKSFDLLKNKDSFTLTFEGSEINTSIGGTFNGIATNMTTKITGKWNANKGNREMKTSDVKSGKETDILAVQFCEALRTVYSYEGSDENHLYLYYKDKGKNFRIAFSPKRD